MTKTIGNNIVIYEQLNEMFVNLMNITIIMENHDIRNVFNVINFMSIDY